MKRLAWFGITLLMVGLAGCDSSNVTQPPGGPSDWSRVSAGLPGSGLVFSLAANGTTLLAGTHGGVFRSTDGGLTWSAATTQPTNSFVLSLAADGTTFLAGSALGSSPTKVTTLITTGATAWAGTNSSGIWRYSL